MRAGVGQYTTGDKQTSRERSRMWFVEAAVETEPQLASALFEIYQEFADGVRFDLRANSLQSFICCSSDQLIEMLHPLAVVRSSVESWASRFHLTESGSAPEWILRCAYCSLSRWQNGGPVLDLALPAVSETLPAIDNSIVPPEFALKHWNPFFGRTRRQFETDLRAHLKLIRKFVIRRLDEIEGAAKASGCKPAATNLNPKRYLWAAQYQVAEIEVSEFWQRLKVHADPRGTRLAIREVLDEVGLTRRPPKNIGRPKKGKSPS